MSKRKKPMTEEQKLSRKITNAKHYQKRAKVKKLSKREKQKIMEDKVYSADLTIDPDWGELFTDVQEAEIHPINSTDVYITINFLQSYFDMSRKRSQDYLEFSKDLFGKKQGILQYFDDQNEDGSIQEVFLRLFEAHTAFYPEVAPKTGFLHIHAFVQLQHCGYFQFHPGQLHQTFQKLFGHSAQIRTPIGSNRALTWKQYMVKEVYNKVKNA